MLGNSWQTHQLPSSQEGMYFMELPVVTTTKVGFIHSLLFTSKANNMCNEYYLHQVYVLFLMWALQKKTKNKRKRIVLLTENINGSTCTYNFFTLPNDRL